MLHRWPFRTQIHVGGFLLAVVFIGLATASTLGMLKFRTLTKEIKLRAYELPLAAQLGQEVSDLRKSVSILHTRLVTTNNYNEQSFSSLGSDITKCRLDLKHEFEQVELAFQLYKKQFESDSPYQKVNSSIPEDDAGSEANTVAMIEKSLLRINQKQFELYLNADKMETDLIPEIESLQIQVSRLPELLKTKMDELAKTARSEYNAWFAYSVVMFLVAVGIVVALAYAFARGIFLPVEKLILGSRRVASGDYDYRVKVEVEGEMAELAGALNEMTANFQEIKDDLDNKVRQRTNEVVRSEQMASVGFLAAGIAHEINNPLAAIAWSAESLESRFIDLLDSDSPMDDQTRQKEIEAIKRYLRRIEDEAFRCKGITGSLLDYSRLDDAEKSSVNIVEVAESVLEMVRPLQKYRDRDIHFSQVTPVWANVNTQELKQVVLNLVTNALESTTSGGNVWIQMRTDTRKVHLIVKDDGCGMDQEVQQHLFEPFYTRRQDGSGTGLGLSITYRIIEEHGGSIRAESSGIDQGSCFTVSLPLANREKYEVQSAA